MQALDRRARFKAAVLAALAGYVDAIGFIGTGGFFLSFMSGNSTRLAVGLADWAPWLLMPRQGLDVQDLLARRPLPTVLLPLAVSGIRQQ